MFALESRDGYRPLAEQDLVVLVGLTGAGKTTLARALGYPTLPNRRELTDRYVLGEPVADRVERFRRVAAWRERHPGGIAELLARGYAPPTPLWLFDGLRGEGELAYALRHLPRARFLVLELDHGTRLLRLLTRGDAFDRAEAGDGDLLALARGVVPEAALREALRVAPVEEVRKKLRIVVEEAKNYGYEGVRRVLGESPRARFLDARRPVEALAAEARAWLEGARADR